MRCAHGRDVAVILILSGALLFALGTSEQRLTPAMALVVFAISANALFIGRGILLVSGAERSFSICPAAELVLGVSATSLFVFLMCILFRLSAGRGLLLCSGLGAGIAAYILVRPPRRGGWTKLDLIVLLGTCFVCIVWCWQAIEAMPTLRATGRLPVWSDYVLQATTVWRFADFGEIAETSVPISDYLAYHYVSHMLPAAVTSLSGIEALTASTSLWTTLGFIVMGLGAYVLGTALAGRKSGIAAVGALLLLPDSAHYGLKNGWFDFHWHEQISTGASYATGLALVALALGVVAWRRVSGGGYFLAAAASLAVLGLRFQVFTPLTIGELMLVAVLWPPHPMWRRFGVWAAIVAISYIGAQLAEYVPRAPHLLSEVADPLGVLKVMLRQGPERYLRFYETVVEPMVPPVPLLFSLGYLTLAVLGLLLVSYVLGVIWCGRHRLLRSERWFPIGFLAASWIIMIMFPPMKISREPYDLLLKNFVLIYAIMAVWSGTFAARWITLHWRRHAASIIVAAAVLLLPIPFLLSKTAQSSTLPWSSDFIGMRVAPGTLETAMFLRATIPVGDVIYAATNYECGPLEALVERSIAFAQGCPVDIMRMVKLAPLAPPPEGSPAWRLLNAEDYKAASAIARQQGMRWFLVNGVEPLAPWLRESGAWQSGDFIVLGPFEG